MYRDRGGPAAGRDAALVGLPSRRSPAYSLARWFSGSRCSLGVRLRDAHLQLGTVRVFDLELGAPSHALAGVRLAVEEVNAAGRYRVSGWGHAHRYQAVWVLAAALERAGTVRLPQFPAK